MAEREREAPLEEKEREASLEEKEREAPLEEKEREAPLEEKEREAPLESEGKEGTPLESSKAVVKSGGTELQSRTTNLDLEVEKSREEIKKAVQNDDYGPVSSIVVICCVIGALALISLVWYVYYSLNQVLAHDANLEEKIASGNTTATFKALKMHTLETNSTIYNLIILVIILLVSAAFGYLVFYKDTSRHRYGKTLTVALYASDALMAQERKVTELGTRLSAKTKHLAALTATLKGREEKIELLLQVDKKNVKEIQRLQHEKSEKEAELRVAHAEVKSMTARYEEARSHMRELKDDVKKKEQEKKVVEQELVAEKMQTSSLRSDLRRETSEKETHRRRVNYLEGSQSQFRERLHDAEKANAVLQIEKQHAEENSGCIVS